MIELLLNLLSYEPGLSQIKKYLHRNFTFVLEGNSWYIIPSNCELIRKIDMRNVM